MLLEYRFYYFKIFAFAPKRERESWSIVVKVKATAHIVIKDKELQFSSAGHFIWSFFYAVVAHLILKRVDISKNTTTLSKNSKTTWNRINFV
jgi:hypothetical protein